MLLALIWVGCILAVFFIADQKQLNLALFLVLAIFFGPVGLLIAILAPAQEKKSLIEGRRITGQGLHLELENIKRNLRYLQNKVEHLEQVLGQEKPAVSGRETAIKSDAGEKNIGVEDERKFAAKEKEPETFEVAFGKYWLNRIGVILFVLGVGFFISYAFQYMSALFKIAVGYLLAAGFLVLGNFLETKERYQKFAWGILAGSWGLFYLSTYAMHYIDQTRIITSPIVEMGLLGLISAAAVIYNLKYKSMTVTALTYMLAFITGGLGSVDYATIGYCAVLTASIVYLSWRLNWHAFLIYGILGAYATSLFWLKPHLCDILLFSSKYSLPFYRFQINTGILTVLWGLFTLGLFILRNTNEREFRYLLIGILINAAAFIILGLNEIYEAKVHLPWDCDIRIYFLVLMALIYFILAVFYKVSNRRQFIVVFLSIAFSILAVAIFIKFTTMSTSFFWLIEMMIIFILGFYYKEFIYRLLASILGILVVLRLISVDYFADRFIYSLGDFQIPHRALIFTFSFFCFSSLAILTQREGVKRFLKKEESDFYFWFFPASATFLLTIILGKDVPSRWMSLGWTLEGVGILALGFLCQQRVFRISALIVLAIASLRIIFVDLNAVNTIYKIVGFLVMGAILLVVSLVYAKFKTKN